MNEDIEDILYREHIELASIKKRAMEILEYFGIAEYAEHKATDLSYGQQRKVEIARAIPKIVNNN